MNTSAIISIMIPTFAPLLIFIVLYLPSIDDSLNFCLLVFQIEIYFSSPLEQICWMGKEQFSELLKSEEENGWPAKDVALNTLRTEFGIETQSNAHQ